MLVLLKKIFSFFYLILYFLHRLTFLFKLRRIFSSPSYIISVGNLSVGGSGKTPMVELLARRLSFKKLFPSIISRGYKRKSQKNIIVSDNKNILANINDSGDEPYMLASSLPGVPVWVGKKSDILGLSYKKTFPKSIILDDGFQSLYIKKNLDILLIDVSVDFNKYKLLPYGLLREPLSAINRANIIVLTKCNFGEKNINKIKALISSYLYNHSTTIFTSNYILSLKNYKNNKFTFFKKELSVAVVAFCGIANSSIFEKEAVSLTRGAFSFVKFSDHHQYCSADFNLIKTRAKKIGSKTILTTKKDFFKIKNYFKNYDLFILDVEHQIINQNAFFKQIENNIKRYYSSDQYIG